MFSSCRLKKGANIDSQFGREIYALSLAPSISP